MIPHRSRFSGAPSTGRGPQDNITRDPHDRTSRKVLSEATSPPSSLEVDLWGRQHECRDQPEKLVVIANTYGSKATIMVTSGTEGPKNLRIPLTVERSLAKMKRKMQRQIEST
jgi:hypothetical protein